MVKTPKLSMYKLDLLILLLILAINKANVLIFIPIHGAGSRTFLLETEGLYIFKVITIYNICMPKGSIPLVRECNLRKIDGVASTNEMSIILGSHLILSGPHQKQNKCNKFSPLD